MRLAILRETKKASLMCHYVDVRMNLRAGERECVLFVCVCVFVSVACSPDLLEYDPDLRWHEKCARIA